MICRLSWMLVCHVAFSIFLFFLACFTVVFFFFNDTATTEIYTLSLHDALPICSTTRSRPRSPTSSIRARPCAICSPPRAASSSRPSSWGACASRPAAACARAGRRPTPGCCCHERQDADRHGHGRPGSARRYRARHGRAPARRRHPRGGRPRRPRPRGHRAAGAGGRRRDPRDATGRRVVGLRRQVARAAAREGAHRRPRGCGRRADRPALHRHLSKHPRAAAAARAPASPARRAAGTLASRPARRADAVRASRAADDGALAGRRLRRRRRAALAVRGARPRRRRPGRGRAARGRGRRRRDGLHRLPRRHPARPGSAARRPGARGQPARGTAGGGAARAVMPAPLARLLLLLPFTALLGVFFAAPLLLMVAISVSRQSFGELQWTFTLHHYARFFSDAYYIGVHWDTLVLGAIVTVASLLLGYPLAYHLARTRSRWKPFLLVAVLSPLLVGIVIRCYGWMILLADRGLINATLVERGWLAKPLPLMYNRFGVAVALVHVFLPFMVLSLTRVLKRIDPHPLEAAMTLGASPRRAFLEVTLPLSLPGILAGPLLVFSLAISSFVGPALPGGFKAPGPPVVVFEPALSVFDWPFGAANAFVLLVISIALIAVYIRVTERALRGIV